MKAYIITSGVIFGLVTVAHICRFVAEGSRLATEPIFDILTFLAAALCFWAFRVLKSIPPAR
jgi:ammonia channel protein AmtB